jgi:hypothetical protein
MRLPEMMEQDKNTEKSKKPKHSESLAERGGITIEIIYWPDSRNA